MATSDYRGSVDKVEAGPIGVWESVRTFACNLSLFLFLLRSAAETFSRVGSSIWIDGGLKRCSEIPRMTRRLPRKCDAVVASRSRELFIPRKNVRARGTRTRASSANSFHRSIDSPEIEQRLTLRRVVSRTFEVAGVGVTG